MNSHALCVRVQCLYRNYMTSLVTHNNTRWQMEEAGMVGLSGDMTRCPKIWHHIGIVLIQL